LVLDEPKAQDKVYTFAPLKMVIDDSLQGELGAVSVDYNDSVWRSGFKITSAKPIGGGAGASAGGCSSGKCC
jgi:Fe-S cluster assembly iron-binding protein IscA